MAERATEHTHFSGLISERGPAEWRAIAWIREPDLTLRETVGPKILATVDLAQDWLRQGASERGFEKFEIVIERLGDEALLVETIKPDGIEEELAATDVDA
jgi:hypothetical protein